MSQIKIRINGHGSFVAGLGRCDNCKRNHFKCNKELPSCNNCKRRGASCTRNLGFKIKPRASYSNVESFYVAKPAPFISSNPQLNIGFLLGPTDWEIVQTKWCSKASSRSYFFYLVRLASISLSENRPDDINFLCSLLLSRFHPTKKIQNNPTESSGCAMDAYFYYFNPFFPLFSKDTFFARPRSYLLLLVMMRVGLRFVQACKSFIEKIDLLLLELTVPSRLSFSLDTLQALLIIQYGLYNSPLDQKRSSLFMLATTITNTLLRGTFNSSKELRLAFQLTAHIDCNLNYSRRTYFLWHLPPLKNYSPSVFKVCPLMAISRCTYESTRVFRKAQLNPFPNLLDQHCSIYLWGHKVLTQCDSVLLHLLRIRFCYTHLQLIELCKPGLIKPIVTISIMLIQLLSVISTGPFVFSRLRFLMLAVKFIAQNFPNPDVPMDQKRLALRTAKCILLQLGTSPQSPYLALYDAILSRYDIDSAIFNGLP